MKKYVVGVDVGGTNIKLGLVHPQGFVIARSHFPTKPFSSSKKKLIKFTQNQADYQRNLHLIKHLLIE